MIFQAFLAAVILLLILRIVTASLFSFVVRICILFLGALGLLLVVDPELSNRVAHLVGVGRGADLIFYVFIAVAPFGVLRFYLRVRSLELRQVELVRELALQAHALGWTPKTTEGTVNPRSPLPHV